MDKEKKYIDFRKMPENRAVKSTYNKLLRLIGKDDSIGKGTARKTKSNLMCIAKWMVHAKGVTITDPRNLKEKHVRQFFDELRNHDYYKSTVAGYRTTFGTILTDLGKTIIRDNILKSLMVKEAANFRGGEQYRPIAADLKKIEEIQSALYAKAEWLGLAYESMKVFGLRAGERLRSVEYIEKNGSHYLRVVDAKNGKPREIKLESEAQIDVSTRVCEFLHRTGQKSLIPTNMKRQQAYDKMRNEIAKLGGTKTMRANSHAARHAYAQACIQGGLSDKEVAHRLGHGRASIIRFYIVK